MRVSFDGGRLNERGVAVAMFDYAFHARARLGIEPIILHNVSDPPDPAHVERFAKAFPTFAYSSEAEWRALVARDQVDVAYVLKTERKPAPISASCRTAVHEVFGFFHPHGDSYAYISSWLAQAMTGGRYPAVPHMVTLPDPKRSLRSELGVPDDAFVVGRHGATNQFNIPFVPKAIEAALERRKNLWFVLLNTDRFSDHERVVHLPGTPDRQRIADFVASCDAGVNARRVGETFGLSIAEFLSQDKPVWVWGGGRDRNHLELVRDPAWIYRTSADLTRKLVDYDPRPASGDWRARVAEFTPERVMESFDRVFLKPGPRDMPRLPLGYRLKTRIEDRVRRWREAQWLES